VKRSIPGSMQREEVGRATTAERATLLMKLGISAVACFLLALAVWQYAMPPELTSRWGLNQLGVEHFRGALGVPKMRLGAAAFRWGFRGALVAAWSGYFLLVWAALRGGKLRRSVLIAATAVLALGLAALWPASLSADVYGYVGYARLQAIHGRSPYLVTSRALVDLGDPTAPFLEWDLQSPYGPAWTWLSVAVVAALRTGSLWWQVVAMKMCAASGVVLAAWAGSALAERFEAGRGTAAFVAIGYNPLFLVEAAGNGHNDLVVMALVLAGLGAFARGQAFRSALIVGLAGALKFVPLLLVPWVAMSAPSRRPRSAALGQVLLVGAAGLLPLLVTAAPFWGQGSLLDGLGARWEAGQSALGTSPLLRAGLGVVLLGLYVAAPLLWFTRSAAEHLLSAWIILSGTVLLASGLWFPWYLAWPWAASLTRWDRRHRTASRFLCGWAILLSLLHTVQAEAVLSPRQGTERPEVPHRA
jgi:hypothetical protein